LLKNTKNWEKQRVSWIVWLDDNANN